VPTFTALKEFLTHLRRREEGQTMAEYGVVLAVIALAVIVAFTALSGGISHAINNVAKVLP
jgi:Flp pilus assembly pilin Flp